MTMTGRDGRVLKMENVFLRGGHVKFIVLPELLKSAPIFKKVQTMKAKKVEASGAGGRGAGRGGRGGGRGSVRAPQKRESSHF